MFEHALVPEPCGCPGKNGGLAQVIQRRTPAWGDRAKAPDYVAQSRWRSQAAAVTKPDHSTRRRSKDGSHCKPEQTLLMNEGNLGSRSVSESKALWRWVDTRA